MRIDDLSAPLGRFVARVSASVATVDCRPSLVFPPTANLAFALVFIVPSGGDQGSAEAPAAATIVAQRAPLPTSTVQGEDSAVIIGPAASAPSPPGNPAPLNILPPSGRISTRPACYHPAASPTAVTAGIRRYGPSSCCLVGPDGTHPVRPRPRRARVERRHTLHSPWPAGIFGRRLLVVFPFPPASSLFGGSGAGYQRPITHHRRGHHPTRPTAVPQPLASGTQCQVDVLAMVVNELNNNWGEQLPHV